MARGDNATTGQTVTRPLEYGTLTDEELKDTVLMLEPGTGLRVWMPTELVQKRERQGWVQVEPTPREARPHDKISMESAPPKRGPGRPRKEPEE